MQRSDDTGREFEVRALAIARARHDPSGLQGSIMFAGRERDGVFVEEHAVSVYEFTKARTKEKARQDGERLKELVGHLSRVPENRYKVVAGYFVTEQEPTAEQRGAIDDIAHASRLNIKALSVVALRNTLVDVEGYITVRLASPFGSTSLRLETAGSVESEPRGYVEPTLSAFSTEETASLGELIDLVQRGGRVALTGDFGIGKKAALKEVFARLRKRYFREPTNHRFPVHVNLRDCAGLKSPREILQRHAEDVGFQGAAGLVSAWRAGGVILVLDGFDELIPTRWIGSARDLKQVRWQALAPVRKLIEETPAGCGIVVSGRPQYFSGQAEMETCLGIDADEVYELQDFDDGQLAQFSGSEAGVPDWLPPRPLLVEFLLRDEVFKDGSVRSASTPGVGWVRILDRVAAREAERVTSIPADTFKQLLGRIALTAKSVSDGVGPVTLHDMRRCFYDVCGYEVEEEGLQALLRLPGLVSDATGAEEEKRSFVDVQFAGAAYGHELANYISSPYRDHPLRGRVPWTTTCSEVAAAVAATYLNEWDFESGFIAAAYSRRIDDQTFDAVLFDVCSVAEHAGYRGDKAREPFFADLIVPILTLSPESGLISRATFRECVIETLDVSEFDQVQSFPTFNDCAIGKVEGWVEVPTSMRDRFMNTRPELFDARSETTAGIMTLSLSVECRIALSILKKVYAQRSAGRKASSLARGLKLEDRHRVESVVDRLVARGIVEAVDGKGEALVLPVRSQRALVNTVLRSPGEVVELLGDA